MRRITIYEHYVLHVYYCLNEKRPSTRERVNAFEILKNGQQKYSIGEKIQKLHSIEGTNRKYKPKTRKRDEEKKRKRIVCNLYWQIFK